jgi:hypothetical protein
LTEPLEVLDIDYFQRMPTAVTLLEESLLLCGLTIA